ncbi:MAG: carboxylesterase family protein, partial [Thermoanaerobaculia bacterium]|nr:carboxylesterase family protein [Thermoanaerobaculia bacterium]
MRAGLSAAAAALALAVAVACSQPGPETSGSGSGDLPVTVVGTEEGLLEGQMADGDAGIRVFRGIPYAAPPVGDLRFRPPAPPFSWKGIRPALEPGAPCWQEISPLTSIYSRGEMDMDENCLVLDLWTGAASAEERRPVMVWFHGGGHTVGHGSSLIFDGTNLARKGVVLVSA